MKFFVFAALTAIAGCGNSDFTVSGPTPVHSYGKVTAQETQGDDRQSYASLLEAHEDAAQQALRVRLDRIRNRLWVLDLDHVYVYDIANKHLIRRIALPGWSVAEFVCQPDMALDRSGTAVISHNLEPRLWQVDANSFQLTEHEIRLVNKEHLDVGFGALGYAPDGTLLGVTASGGSLWSIDIANASARQIEPNVPVQDACALTASTLAKTYLGKAE